MALYRAKNFLCILCLDLWQIDRQGTVLGRAGPHLGENALVPGCAISVLRAEGLRQQSVSGNTEYTVENWTCQRGRYQNGRFGQFYLKIQSRAG